MAARRVVDWNTPHGVDPDTPVADLHDRDSVGRDAFVLLSDEEREAQAWLLGKCGDPKWRKLLDQAVEDAADRQAVMRMRHEQRRWHDRLWARTLAIVTILATINLPQWISLFHSGH